jgi:prolyl-tRNA editing enzyme YbaK/EbsC (Cys-tRNA(Pro) deacylase)
MRTDPTERRVIDQLEALGATYELVECDPESADTAAFCERYGYPLDISANAILVASRRPPGRHALCLALATTRLDVNRAVRDLLDVKRLSFASPDVTIEVTGMAIGGVTPFGIPDDLAVFVDERIIALRRCIVGGGSRAMKVVVDPEVFHRMDGVAVVPGLAG